MDKQLDNERIDGELKMLEKVELIAKSMKDLMYCAREPDMVDIMFDTLIDDHRTNQQRFISRIVQLLIKYADSEHDRRNEAAVNLCKQIKSVVDNYKLWGPRGLPCY